MSLLREAVNDGRTGKASSKRIIALMGAVSLSFATVILAVAAMLGDKDVANALWAVSTPLALLGGVNYVGGKLAEAQRGPAA